MTAARHPLEFRPALIFLILLAVSLISCGNDDPPSGQTSGAAVERISVPWTGDLKETLENRRFLRALVTYNQTNFFIEQGNFRGLEYDLLKHYEAFLNRKSKKNDLKVKIVFSVLPFEELLPALTAGEGDIVAAGLTITPGRRETVDFTRPYIDNVDEVVVGHKEGTDLRAIEDLEGRKIHVMAGTSHVTHLKQINLRLRRQFLRPIRIVKADIHLEEEDLLQMVNAGIYDLTVADSHLAAVWSKTLPNLRIYAKIPIHTGGEIAWAVRKSNPQLRDSLNRFLASHRQGTTTGNMLIKRYYENTRWIQNPLSPQDQARLEGLKSLFQKYAQRYRFDWLKLVALAYQESRLNQNARSHKGAVGIMQLLPSTAAGPAIGISDISGVENNIHAGVKYLAYLRDTYFNDPDIEPDQRVDFAIAAYNAGPARINRIRKKAATLGLDPDQWFFNVEHAARRFIGWEPVRYVSNIYIYYIAYRTAYRVVNQKPPDGLPERPEQNGLLYSSPLDAPASAPFAGLPLKIC